MGTVQCDSNTTAAPYPAGMDTKTLGVSEVLLCVILCLTSELVYQVASAQTTWGSEVKGIAFLKSHNFSAFLRGIISTLQVLVESVL